MVRHTVNLIDVLWLHPNEPHVACAFEVEQSTSIYSAILRMAPSLPDRTGQFYLVAPERREQEVMAQMLRPALQSPTVDFKPGYLPAGEFKRQCDAMCRLGVDRSVLLKIAKAHRLAQSAVRRR